MKRLCIYHRVDLDGQCSAAIVARRYPDVELFGWNYGDTIPWDRIEEADEVVLVDVSFQPWGKMERLADIASGDDRGPVDIIWIDHHKTAIEGHEDCLYFGGTRQIGQAACELTWKYYFPDEPMPRAVHLLGRWDVWAWPDMPERDEIEAFQFGMRSEKTGPEQHIWAEILSGRFDDERERITDAGRSILSYRDQQNARLAKSAFETLIEEPFICPKTSLPLVKMHRVLAVNAGGGSTVLDSVWAEHPDCVAMLMFFWAGRHWTYSLYSDRGFDCSVVAKARGGGGHAGAAGFQCDELPFELGG